MDGLIKLIVKERVGGGKVKGTDRWESKVSCLLKGRRDDSRMREGLLIVARAMCNPVSQLSSPTPGASPDASRGYVNGDGS